VCPLQDRKQPDVCHSFFHDVPFEAYFASDIPELHSMSAMPGVDGFTMKVDALYKVRGITRAPLVQRCVDECSVFFRESYFWNLPHMFDFKIDF